MEIRPVRFADLGIVGPLYVLTEPSNNVIGMPFPFVQNKTVPALLAFTTREKALEAAGRIADRKCTPVSKSTMEETVAALRSLEGYTHIALDYIPPLPGETGEDCLFTLKEFTDALERTLSTKHPRPQQSVEPR